MQAKSFAARAESAEVSEEICRVAPDAHHNTRRSSRMAFAQDLSDELSLRSHASASVCQYVHTHNANIDTSMTSSAQDPLCRLIRCLLTRLDGGAWAGMKSGAWSIW